jgi:hypothetical protein
MHREIRIRATKPRKKVVLEGAYGALSGVGAMDAWWYQLEGDVLLDEVFLEHSGAFIVKTLELGAEAGVHESVVNGLEGFQDFRRCFGRHGLGVDAVTVVVVEDKNL